ncbi:MAG: hypothetical protein AAB495_01950 [Patescibacteria group bacterium]
MEEAREPVKDFVRMVFFGLPDDDLVDNSDDFETPLPEDGRRVLPRPDLEWHDRHDS